MIVLLLEQMGMQNIYSIYIEVYPIINFRVTNGSIVLLEQKRAPYYNGLLSHSVSTQPEVLIFLFFFWGKNYINEEENHNIKFNKCILTE